MGGYGGRRYMCNHRNPQGKIKLPTNSLRELEGEIRVPSKNRTLENNSIVHPGTCLSGGIKKGPFLRVTDVEGGQVADFVSLKLNDPTEYLDCLYTNIANGR
jgi:uncharacterized protein YcgI (DUF1989 family)